MLSDDRNTQNGNKVLRQVRKDWTENASNRNENEAVRYNGNNLGQ